MLLDSPIHKPMLGSAYFMDKPIVTASTRLRKFSEPQLGGEPGMVENALIPASSEFIVSLDYIVSSRTAKTIYIERPCL